MQNDDDEPADQTGFYRNTASPSGDPFPTQRHQIRPPPATGFNCRQQLLIRDAVVLVAVDNLNFMAAQ
jgi:hypothetical protein